MKACKVLLLLAIILVLYLLYKTNIVYDPAKINPAALGN